MKILILTGSPRSKGTTSLLADEFAKGAKEAGHEVVRFDTGILNIRPCIGCHHCQKNGTNKCVSDDAMTRLYPEILSADLIAFVTPVYYFGISTQLKTAIDRFFSINKKIRKFPKKAVLLAACGDKQEWAMDPLKLHYETLCRYLRFEDMGQVLAYSCHEREDMENSKYPEMAIELGRSLVEDLTLDYTF